MPAPVALAPVPAGTCDIPYTGPALLEFGVAGATFTDTIDTSCVSSVTLSLLISHLGSLETSGAAIDTLNVSYSGRQWFCHAMAKHCW